MFNLIPGIYLTAEGLYRSGCAIKNIVYPHKNRPQQPLSAQDRMAGLTALENIGEGLLHRIRAEKRLHIEALKQRIQNDT